MIKEFIMKNKTKNISNMKRRGFIKNTGKYPTFDRAVCTRRPDTFEALPSSNESEEIPTTVQGA